MKRVQARVFVGALLAHSSPSATVLPTTAPSHKYIAYSFVDADVILPLGCQQAGAIGEDVGVGIDIGVDIGIDT